MDPLKDHNSFDVLAVVVAVLAMVAVLAVAVVVAAAAAIGIREMDAVGPCGTDERSVSSIAGRVVSVFPLSNAILLLTLYNQLWEIFSTFLFLVDATDK